MRAYCAVCSVTARDSVLHITGLLKNIATNINVMIRDPVPFQPATKAPTSGVASCLQWVLLSLPSAQPATTGTRPAGGGGDLTHLYRGGHSSRRSWRIHGARISA
jgi:hypothetical protein